MNTTTNKEEYNGWTNKPTWLANLWADELGLSEPWPEMAIQILKENPDKRAAISTLADALQDQFDQFQEEGELTSRPLFTDLLNWALAHVNWRELAEHILDDIPAKP